MSDTPNNTTEQPPKKHFEQTVAYQELHTAQLRESIDLNQKFYVSLNEAGCGHILNKWFEDMEAMRLLHREKIDALFERYSRGEL